LALALALRVAVRFSLALGPRERAAGGGMRHASRTLVTSERPDGVAGLTGLTSSAAEVASTSIASPASLALRASRALPVSMTPSALGLEAAATLAPVLATDAGL